LSKNIKVNGKIYLGLTFRINNLQVSGNYSTERPLVDEKICGNYSVVH